ncbi:2Fe-2S iron-sulfur cluster binding domain-containing protein [Pseudoalteromonas sp. JBTF-M23]|uniref:2Fe-2S iron-sulfur cluster binding domain-containing protein n=1 Tax=Pseudoalteromonas caenipelagi TaxID=2726988 RepID=A0A849VFC6_9GAMM|nr:2Fe-2S iron-sulfur cluster-binding protein [Pseudoalteromonas caenipelagi]NOU51966.1 2Fe-2S iron-sulfur cluster binding domain-containing protein [Pseudoalteromonas caenipelagi]
MLQLNKSLHKWLSLLVGLQLIIWLVTGLYFNLMDHKKGSGNANFRPVAHAASELNAPFIPLKSLDFAPAQQIKLLWVLGHPYYQITHHLGAHSYQAKQVTLLDAYSGQEAAINETLARTIALKSFKGAVNIISANLLQPPIAELPKHENPLWQVKLSDAENTNVYIDSNSGRVIAHINDDRRLRDLMFTLHFMDYFGTGGFNHWLIIVFAIATLLLSMTGITWLIERFNAGQLSFAFKSKKQRIKVIELAQQQTHELELKTGISLFDGLAAAGIVLPSNCGGGGTCGLCKVRCNENTQMTDADKANLSNSKLEQGYRLACQHNTAEVTEIEVRSRTFNKPKNKP